MAECIVERGGHRVQQLRMIDERNDLHGNESGS